LNATKDKFFSIVAHDLKNPFFTLIGLSEILLNDKNIRHSDQFDEFMEGIYETASIGYNLLENLLKWSQSQTDKILFEPKKVNLHEIAQYCIDDVENQSRFKDIDVNNEVPQNYHIIADVNLLKTILRNLINNAVKFTDRNGMISVACNKIENDIIISVKDTGIGMSEKDLQEMFKIDKVKSKPGTNRERGSGLGLILCKEFVEKHGGKIWVESELDVGSTFSFTIPKIIQMN
jgi:signal transduction histidine kinase